MEKRKLEDLKKLLQENGIETDFVETVRNGVIRRGLRLGTENVAPVIYYSFGETALEFLTRAREIMSRPIPNINDSFTDPEYVREHTVLCIQKRSKEDLCKRDYLDLEVYMRVLVDSESEVVSTIKVTKSFLQTVGMTEDELFKAAINNSRKQFYITSMNEVLQCESFENSFFYIATTESKVGGAAALYYSEIFQAFCEKMGEEGCIILPSSTEEILLVPKSLQFQSFTEMAQMVYECNVAVVEPEFRLNPTIYYYDLQQDVVEIVAEMG